jgi:hypothetical protein
VCDFGEGEWRRWLLCKEKKRKKGKKGKKRKRGGGGRVEKRKEKDTTCTLYCKLMRQKMKNLG